MSSHLHPVEKAGVLESRFRKLVQNPEKIVKKYIQSGMTILDLGCGTGYFTTEIARLLGESGKIIAVDVQDGMLDILRKKIENSELKHNIQIHKSKENSLELSEKFDFVFAFYVFHEMRYWENIIPELKVIVKPGAKILIAEQKFHVPRKTFNTFIQKMEDIGFEVCERPKIFLSRAVIMQIRE